MGQITLPGNPPIAIRVRRSARARRLSLRLSQLDGRVTLTLPQRVALAEGEAFAREKESWLRDHIARQEAQVSVGIGVVLPVEGTPCRIVAGAGRSLHQSGDIIAVPGQPERAAARLAGHLKTRARNRLSAASDHYAAALGLEFKRLTLRDTRSRWGSCSTSGGLMYSWRLIMAPPEVLDYVAAHEVAHLREMNHSPAFWDLVRELYGDWRAPRRWLREEGAGLHRYRFGD